MSNVVSRPLLSSQESPLASGHKGLSYLHFGSSLAGIEAVLAHFGRQGRAWTTDIRRLVNSLPHFDAKSRLETLDVLDFLIGTERRKVPLEQLAAELDRSRCWRSITHSLECRGFSFRLCENPRLRGCTLSAEVNRKFAILADLSLYFPPKVRNALRTDDSRMRNKHITDSIGWMLIMEKIHGKRRWWYVVNVQSDLMKTSQSALKEQFRGWQRVLFWLLLQAAARNGVAMLALPSVEAVTWCRKRHRAWRPLYDGLAKSFGMRSVSNPYRTNIQPLKFWNKTMNRRFYVGSVRRLVTRAESNCSDILALR